MSEGGQAALLDEVAGELAQFAEDGQEKWRKFGGRSRLPSIEHLIREHYRLDREHRLGADRVCDAIKAACEGLDEEWRLASLAYLGFARESSASRSSRGDAAAEHLRGSRGSMTGRTFRATRTEGRHSGRTREGRTYETWSEVTLAFVADALIRQCGGDPETEVDSSRNGHLSDDDVRRLGDIVRSEIAALYKPIKAEDFSRSFFHRESTDAYIESLASLRAVTLYTGGAISTEVHAPLSDTLIARALRERLRLASNDLNQAQRKRVIDALMHAYPPTQLGSIAREFVRQQSSADPGDVDALEGDTQGVFAREFQDALVAGRDTGGFLALGLGALAFSLRKAGRDPVRILTTSYDDKISESEARVQEYFRDLKGYAFDPRPLESTEEADSKSIPLYRLNGHVRNGGGSDALIVGEADSLTQHYQARGLRIDQALAESACIFIGTELTEPDVLSKLVTSPYSEGMPRYAIILSPDLDLDSPEERAKVVNLATQRFLHLGVMPIVIDFPHQAPQFLIEVALRLQQGKENYRSYATRLQTWWDSWAKDFGFPTGARGTEGKRNQELQKEWMNELERIRDLIARKHLGIPAGEDRGGEQIEIEVWVRHPDERSLIHWSTSDGLWLNPRTADRSYIFKGHDVPVQRAFREGTPVFGRVNPPRGDWRYQLSIPLVLRKQPWHHLPVGVVNILSSKDPPNEDDEGNPMGAGGKLGGFSNRPDFASDLAELTGAIKKPINALLDPGSPHWKQKKRAAGKRKRTKAKRG